MTFKIPVYPAVHPFDPAPHLHFFEFLATFVKTLLSVFRGIRKMRLSLYFG